MRRFFLISAVLFGLASFTHAETRAAFVVGNSAYENAPRLSNPVRDARLVGDTLVSLGFDVTRHQDLTRESFAKALGAFLKKSRDADVTFFYFAGHGMQYDGQNYLVGTDAELVSELDIEGETIALNKVVELLEKNSKAALVFVDACRDNPLATDFYRRNFSETRALNSRGLARVRSRIDGSMLVFAAGPGQVAYDGDGRNSPFATALATHLPTEGKEILTLTKRIIGDVREATDGRQSPIVTNDLTKEIFLREAALRPQRDGPSNFDAARAAEDKVFDAAKFLRTPRSWASYFDLYPNGYRKDEALQFEAVAFREELRERLKDGILWPSREVQDSDLPEEAIKRLGLSRTDVLAMQAILTRLGYDLGGVDGQFGSRTIDALVTFQKAHGLTSDGVPDRATLSMLGLRTRSGKEVDRFPIANQVGRTHTIDRVELLGEDPRLVAVLREYNRRYRISYGFFEGRLYVAMVIGHGNSWKDVTRRAELAGGHLATITSKAENDFIVELIRYDEGFWSPHKNEWVAGPTIGLLQKEGAREPSGGWEWYTGEKRTFTNWVPGFPNNNDGRASYGEFGHNHPADRSSRGKRNFWGWDDFYNVRQAIVIEIP